MPERTDQQSHQHSPGAATARDCHLCAFLRHPAQAKAGRTLQRYLAVFPLPKQGANA
ncbi:hypothetical protein ACFUIY_14710 [Streptomyces griseorubiginosus]|uniref:hypothetical protein n=1 Tax=Streptomyces griseorubiginosus TaxID=67304 RepID=UPI0036255382